MVVMVHTPHRDKKTRHHPQHGDRARAWHRSGRVIIDHNNEETVEDVLDRGFWAAFTLYPAHQDGQRAHGGDRAPLRLGAHLHRLELRLGRVRSAGGAEDRAADARARHPALRTSKHLLRQCARGLRSERADSRRRTGSTPAASTSARCSRATPCCAGSSRASTSCRPSPSATKAGVQVTAVGTRSVALRSERREATDCSEGRRPCRLGAVYQQRFAVRYDYPVHFTARSVRARQSGIRRRRFRARAQQAPPLRRLHRCRRGGELAGAGARHRCLRASITATRLQLVADPEIMVGGEQVKNDPELVTRLQQPPAANSASIAMPTSSPSAAARCSTWWASSRPPRIAACATSACPPRCWRRTIPASA